LPCYIFPKYMLRTPPPQRKLVRDVLSGDAHVTTTIYDSRSIHAFNDFGPRGHQQDKTQQAESFGPVTLSREKKISEKKSEEKRMKKAKRHSLTRTRIRIRIRIPFSCVRIHMRMRMHVCVHVIGEPSLPPSLPPSLSLFLQTTTSSSSQSDHTSISIESLIHYAT
jgi:hypothetical protein